VQKLCGGIAMLAEKRSVRVVRGEASFSGPKLVTVQSADGQHDITFDYAIIATGSKPAMPKAFDFGHPRVMTSTEALDVADIPENLLVIGGGYIGLELGTAYASLGSKVVLAEALDSILAGADADLVRPVMAYARKAFKEVRLGAKVLKIVPGDTQVTVEMELGGQKREEIYDRVLVAVGRVPNTDRLGVENTKVTLDERGFIRADDHLRTAEEHIFAVGDVAGGVLLAHKAFREARIAVDTLVGAADVAESYIIPAVVFTDPEVAWCGLTEAEAKAQGLVVEVAKFPWGASGRAFTLDRPDGLTKLIIDPKTERILGVGMVGHGAGELIAEGVVAVEMKATAKDLSRCVHPHPTLSETVMEAAEVFYGHATHTLSRKRVE
jgi:dihydrolipoamide dehydrogenase